jgi:hypothetical protein
VSDGIMTSVGIMKESSDSGIVLLNKERWDLVIDNGVEV